MADQKNIQTDLMSLPTPSLISKDIKVVGEMNSKENIRIEGEFSGSIEVDGFLRVGKNGRIEAEVKVNSIAIEGEVKGNITAKEKVHLYPTGQVTGDIHCPRTGLSIDPGALFEGRSVMHDELEDIIKRKSPSTNTTNDKDQDKDKDKKSKDKK